MTYLVEMTWVVGETDDCEFWYAQLTKDEVAKFTKKYPAWVDNTNTVWYNISVIESGTEPTLFNLDELETAIFNTKQKWYS